MMALTDIADRAVENQALLKHVRDHTLTFFRHAWMKLDEAQPGSLHLLPQEELATLLATDISFIKRRIRCRTDIDICIYTASLWDEARYEKLAFAGYRGCSPRHNAAIGPSQAVQRPLSRTKA